MINDDRRRTVNKISNEMAVSTPDGTVVLGKLSRATRRNFAKQLYRKTKRPVIDANANRLALYMANLRRDEDAARAVLVSEAEDAYLKTSHF